MLSPAAAESAMRHPSSPSLVAPGTRFGEDWGGRDGLGMVQVHCIYRALHFCCVFSLVPQTVKCLPIMQETWVQSLGWEDPLGKEMATHSSTLAWKSPMDGGAW